MSGDTSRRSEALGPSTSFRFGTENYRWRLIADTLIHEMAHLAVDVDELGGGAGDYGHGQTFADKCNRIGSVLGGPAVSPVLFVGLEDSRGSDLWPNRHLAQKYGTLFSSSEIKKYAFPKGGR